MAHAAALAVAKAVLSRVLLHEKKHGNQQQRLKRHQGFAIFDK
jgi:hypothetical protein